MWRLVTPDFRIDSVLELDLARHRSLSLDALLLDVDCTLTRYHRGEPLPEIGEIRPATEEEIYAQVEASNGVLRGMTIHDETRKAHVLMGLVMTALRGRVEGAAIVERVRAAAEGTC